MIGLLQGLFVLAKPEKREHQVVPKRANPRLADFARVFGALGEGFIHVHHIVPIGKIGKEYKIDPIADLIPVCPNCHAMIHRTEPPLTIEQLRGHIGILKS